MQNELREENAPKKKIKIKFIRWIFGVDEYPCSLSEYIPIFKILDYTPRGLANIFRYHNVVMRSLLTAGYNVLKYYDTEVDMVNINWWITIIKRV